MGPNPLPARSGHPPQSPRSKGTQLAQRRSLANVGGPIHVEAPNRLDRELLTLALDVKSDDPYATSHVHGFHSYPARLHPRTAQVLVRGLANACHNVLDPFCGSGTVLVEAQIAGRVPLGIDANPLAVALTHLKLHRPSPAELRNMVGLARSVIDSAESRRQSKARPLRRYPARIATQFDPHVLLELDGLHGAIGLIGDPFIHSALMLVFSSILNKVSRRANDTTSKPTQKRLASGFVIRFFGKKVTELASRIEALNKLLSEQAPAAPRVTLGDARSLPFADRSIAAIVTSPPYPGVYDYVEHHRLRLDWLGFSARHLEQHELGARRHLQGQQARSARSAFNAQLLECLREMARVLQPDGTAALIVADSVIGPTAWYADQEIGAMAGDLGLNLAAQAFQARPHFHGPSQHAFAKRPRSERVLILRHTHHARIHETTAQTRSRLHKAAHQRGS